MSRQIIVKVDNEIKEKFYRLARVEGKTASEKIRELLENYIKKSDIGAVVDSLWERIGAKIKKKAFTEKDVERIIKETRASKRASR